MSNFIYQIIDSLFNIIIFIIFTQFVSSIFIEHKNRFVIRNVYIAFVILFILLSPLLIPLLNIHNTAKIFLSLILLLSIYMGYTYLFYKTKLIQNIIVFTTYYLMFNFIIQVSNSIHKFIYGIERSLSIWGYCLISMIILTTLYFASKGFVNIFEYYKEYCPTKKEFWCLIIFGLIGFISITFFSHVSVLIITPICEAVLLIGSVVINIMRKDRLALNNLENSYMMFEIGKNLSNKERMKHYSIYHQRLNQKLKILTEKRDVLCKKYIMQKKELEDKKLKEHEDKVLKEPEDKKLKKHKDKVLKEYEENDISHFKIITKHMKELGIDEEYDPKKHDSNKIAYLKYKQICMNDVEELIKIYGYHKDDYKATKDKK